MTDDSPPRIAPVIKCQGAVIDQSLMQRVVSVQVDRGFGLVGRARIRFRDRGYAVAKADTFALGTKVSISEPRGGALLEGTVTGINLEQPPGENPEFIVVIDDAAYDLSRGTQQTTHLNGTYTQAIETIAQRHSMTPEIDAISGSEAYLLQVGTDLEYLNSIVDRIGYTWWVEGPSTLVVTKPALGSPVAELVLNADSTVASGNSLTSFSLRASGLRPTELQVNGWDPDAQQDLTANSSNTSAGQTADLIQNYVGAGPARKLSASRTAVAARPPLTVDEAKRLADSLYDDWTSAAVVGRGVGGINSTIKPGVTVKVVDAGPAAGNYLVSEVQHTYDQSGFSTRFVAGPRRPSGLVDTLGGQAPDPGFLMSGLVVGKVTDNGDPDKAGRVKVKYTGVSQVESPWARVVTLGAGAARGVVFQPEVDDEVLVGFEHGDTRRPVVIGGLYSKRNTLPTGSDFVSGGKVGYRRITSRRNHMIEMADGDDPADQHILLLLGTQPHKLRLGADRFDIEVGQGKGLTIKAGDAKFDISSSGDVTIEGMNVTIKANSSLKLEGGTQAELKGQQVAVQGTQVSVKADGMGSIEASGPLTVKGATVAIN